MSGYIEEVAADIYKMARDEGVDLQGEDILDTVIGWDITSAMDGSYYMSRAKAEEVFNHRCGWGYIRNFGDDDTAMLAVGYAADGNYEALDVIVRELVLSEALEFAQSIERNHKTYDEIIALEEQVLELQDEVVALERSERRAKDVLERLDIATRKQLKRKEARELNRKRFDLEDTITFTEFAVYKTSIANV